MEMTWIRTESNSISESKGEPERLYRSHRYVLLIPNADDQSQVPCVSILSLGPM